MKFVILSRFPPAFINKLLQQLKSKTHGAGVGINKMFKPSS